METTVAVTKPTYTVAQQAWLNFVDKVRRGEQVDPTGQYVKDGTIIPDDAEPHTRPKLDAARDKYPFHLLPDGTVVMLKAVGREGGTNIPVPPDDPPVECPPGGCTGVPTGPTTTSTFVSSVGLGGSGDIVDIKVAYQYPDGNYIVLNADLNKGAGGSYIYYEFMRNPSDVLRGREYFDPYNPKCVYVNAYDPVTSYVTGTGSGFPRKTYPTPPGSFYPIWLPSSSFYTDWENSDLNEGAHGAYIYSYQSKDASRQGAAPFHEIGVLSGNSDQIQPPAGWIKAPNDLNEGAGGDYIYFCYKQ